MSTLHHVCFDQRTRELTISMNMGNGFCEGNAVFLREGAPHQLVCVHLRLLAGLIERNHLENQASCLHTLSGLSPGQGAPCPRCGEGPCTNGSSV